MLFLINSSEPVSTSKNVLIQEIRLFLVTYFRRIVNCLFGCLFGYVKILFQILNVLTTLHLLSSIHILGSLWYSCWRGEVVIATSC